MSAVRSSAAISASKRTTAILLCGILALAGLTSISSSASATTAANPTIVFDGNTLATSVPATETSTRISSDSFRVSTESLSRTTTTTRAGYTFGGWSLVRGDAATTEITTTTTGDTTRTLFAVWNTVIAYDGNGADAGSLPARKTSDVYRFGQNFTLAGQGTLAKSGYAFGGWMPSTVSNTRLSTYQAGSADVGNITVYASWIKTVAFNGNTATSGTIPAPRIFTAGGDPIKLPVLSEMTLRKPFYEFVGWSLTPNGAVISNPGSYIPVVSQQTLYAIWRIQSTKSTTAVIFSTGKFALRSAQKLVIRDMIDAIKSKSLIKITLAATRPSGSAKSLAKSRNTAVMNYIKSLGVVATYTRSTSIGKGTLSSSLKNNRVTITASWLN